MKHQRLINAQLFTSISMEKEPDSPPQLNVLGVEQNVFAQPLAQFPQITTPHICEKVAEHETVHHIVTKGPPIHARPRRLSPSKLTIARYEFNKMLTMGIIRRPATPWASPFHMMQKPAGGWRPYGRLRSPKLIVILFEIYRIFQLAFPELACFLSGFGAGILSGARGRGRCP